MKRLYVALIAVGTGIAGFAVGGGLGLFGGATAGSLAGGVVGGTVGMCATIDAATELKMLTPEQAEKIGVKLGQNLNIKGEGKLPDFDVNGKTPSCNRLVQGIAQARK